jgi:hypothetical protein
LWADIYSVAPSGIFVPHDSSVKRPEDLAGVPISVGYQSGSHYSSIQALEPYLAPEQIKLSFTEGMLFKRLDNLLEGKSQASALFSGPYYLAEQLGFRKIIDTTFMIASMITGEPDEADLKRFYNALKRAQRDIDLRPDRYTHYYKNEFPARYHDIMDTRRWGPGERIVFEPYTADAFNEAREIVRDGCCAGPADHSLRPRHREGCRVLSKTFWLAAARVARGGWVAALPEIHVRQPILT